MGTTVLERNAPRILMATTSKWLSTARLAASFAEMGSIVEAVCPPNHPLNLLPTCRKTYNLSTIRPLVSLEQAITTSCPDLIVSCDERMLDYLRSLHASASVAIQRLIERSVGDLSAIETALARSALVELAIAEGIQTPCSVRIDSRADLRERTAHLELPFVLKADTSAGGQGVRVVERHDQAAILWQRLRGPVSIPQTASRLIRDREWDHIPHYFTARTFWSSSTMSRSVG